MSWTTYSHLSPGELTAEAQRLARELDGLQDKRLVNMVTELSNRYDTMIGAAQGRAAVDDSADHFKVEMKTGIGGASSLFANKKWNDSFAQIAKQNVGLTATQVNVMRDAYAEQMRAMQRAQENAAALKASPPLVDLSGMANDAKITIRTTGLIDDAHDRLATEVAKAQDRSIIERFVEWAKR